MKSQAYHDVGRTMMKQMTNAEYLSYQGSRCPFCGSQNISALGDPEPDGNTAVAEVECLECGKRWQDVFSLVGYIEEQLA